MIKFAYTILYVKDVSTAVIFYEKAFGFKRKFITPENDYAELDTGSTILSFTSLDLAESNLKDGFTASDTEQKPLGFEIAFVTDDVDTLVVNALAHGARLESSAIVKPWGQTVAYIRDLDGFLIELCTEISN